MGHLFILEGIRMMEYWVNHWVAVVCAFTLGCIVGYLYREKRLWDHKKGTHAKKP